MSRLFDFDKMNQFQLKKACGDIQRFGGETRL